MSMTGAAPQKFSFDLDLGQSGRKSRVLGELELEKMLREAEERGFSRGFAEGENTAANRSAAALATAARELADRTAAIAAQSDETQRQIMASAAELAVGVGKKMAAHLIARSPMGEIRALITECLTSLENVPHLVIRCHPDLAERVESEAKAQMQTSGFSGRLIVMGEPDIMLGDARLEWVDGGLVRDLQNISARIDERVSAFIAANSPPPAHQNRRTNSE